MNIKAIKARIRSIRKRLNKARSIFLVDGLTRALRREQSVLHKLTQ